KESAVCVVVRVAISRAVVVAETQPGLQPRQNSRLDSAFHVHHARAVVERAPFAELPGGDTEKLDRPGARFRHMHVMPTVGSDPDIPHIRGPNGNRPVVLLEDAPPVMIVDPKKGATRPCSSFPLAPAR